MKKENKAKIIVIAVISILVLCVVGTTVLALIVVRNPLMSSRLEQFRTDLGEMFDLQKKIAATYPAEGVEIEIQNGNVLIISLVNPETDSVTFEEQEKEAEEIAKFVWENYTERELLDEIQIAFIKHQSILFFYIDQENSFSFDTDSLR